MFLCSLIHNDDFKNQRRDWITVLWKQIIFFERIFFHRHTETINFIFRIIRKKEKKSIFYFLFLNFPKKTLVSGSPLLYKFSSLQMPSQAFDNKVSHNRNFSYFLCEFVFNKAVSRSVKLQVQKAFVNIIAVLWVRAFSLKLIASLNDEFILVSCLQIDISYFVQVSTFSFVLHNFKKLIFFSLWFLFLLFVK